MPPADPDITAILREIRADCSPGADTNRWIFQAVYAELRSIAARLMAGERSDHTLQPTELVHEVYLRLVDESRISWEGRHHFLGIAAHAMRRILVDHARARGTDKRGGGWCRLTIEDCAIPGVPPREADVDILRLHDALGRLAEADPRAARVCELRIFGGFTMANVASVVGISLRTANYDWATCKVWLAREVLRDA